MESWEWPQFYLNDCGSRNSANTLRCDVEDTLQNADVAGDHESNGDGRIDVASGDMTEGLQQQQQE